MGPEDYHLLEFLTSLTNNQVRDPLVEESIRPFIETKAVAIFKQNADLFKTPNSSIITTRVLSHIEMTEENEAKILSIL